MKIKPEEFKYITKTSCIRWDLGNFNICMSYPLHIILFSEYREMARYTSLQYVVSFLIHSSRPFVTLIHLSFLEDCVFHLNIFSNKNGFKHKLLSIYGIMFWTSILHSLSVTNFQLDLKYYRDISLVFKSFICKPTRAMYFILRLQLFYGIRICIRHPAEKNTIIYPKGVSLTVPFPFLHIYKAWWGRIKCQ